MSLAQLRLKRYISWIAVSTASLLFFFFSRRKKRLSSTSERSTLGSSPPPTITRRRSDGMNEPRGIPFWKALLEGAHAVVTRVSDTPIVSRGIKARAVSDALFYGTCSRHVVYIYIHSPRACSRIATRRCSSAKESGV